MAVASIAAARARRLAQPLPTDPVAGESEFMALANLTPAIRTLTGETFDGSPVYREYFTGTTPAAGANADLTTAADILTIIRVPAGWVVGGDSNNWQPTDFVLNGSSDRLLMLTLTTGDDINMSVAGSFFASRAYKISLDYILTA